MNDQNFDINSLRIASPCSIGWERMTGDERTRHCELCSLNVYNISELTAVEVRRLVGKREGRLCIRMYRRFDGTVLTKDCPVGLRAVRKRVARFAGATLSAILGLFSITFGQNDEKNSIDAAISRIATVSDVVREHNLAGRVVDSNGGVIPGLTILLYKEGETIPVKTSSDHDGRFAFSSVPDGVYTLEVPAHTGFKKLLVRNLQIQRAKLTEVVLELVTDEATAVVGIVAGPEMVKMIDMTTPGPTTTVITREMLDRMPGRRPF